MNVWPVAISRLTARFGGHDNYWRIRRRGLIAAFRLKRAWLRLRLGSGSATRGAGATVTVIRTAAGAVAFAATLIALLYVTERWRFSILQFLHLDHGWFERQARRPLNNSAYDTALQTIGGVGGVFVALYFATISGIVGGIYAQTSHNIRDLVLGDRVGRSYVRIIATLTATAALLGLVRSAGATAWHASIILLALLVGVGVFAFVALLRRAFFFFDATVLAPRVAEDFLRWAGRSTRRGSAVSDKSLQDAFRRGGEAAVSALEAIVDVVAQKERIDPEPVGRLALNIAVAARRYARTKQRIPTGSLWFGQRARHSQWYLSSAPAVSVAGSTFTSLPPEAAPDPLWVEERLTAALLELLRALLRTKNYSSIPALLHQLARTTETLAEAWDISLAKNWSTAVVQEVVQAALVASPTDTNEQRAIIEMLDTALMLPVGIEVGLARAHEALTNEAAVAGLSNAETTGERPLLPRRALEQLESLRQQLVFEMVANAPVRTPEWFVQEQVIFHLQHLLAAEIRPLIAWQTQLFARHFDQFRDARRFVEAAAVASRGLEASGRIAVLLSRARELASLLEENSRLGDDLIRPDWTWGEWIHQAEEFQVDEVTHLASTMVFLSFSAPRDDLPDYLGQALHQTGEAAFNALPNGRYDLFEHLYRHYFFGALLMFQRLQQELRQQQPMAALPWLKGPLADLLDLSGYALAFAELDGNPAPWRTVKNVWDEHLGTPEGANLIPLIEALLGAGIPNMSARDLVRSWWQEVDARLRALPLREREDIYEEPEIEHPSPLIKALGEGAGYGGTRGIEIFIARYLLRHPLGADADFRGRAWVVRRLADLPTLGSEE